jgi:hypothetical protein
VTSEFAKQQWAEGRRRGLEKAKHLVSVNDGAAWIWWIIAMCYAAYREAGYPVGSGSVESACKVVVQERMKQAGMRWSRPGAQAMLALRSILLGERWDAVWAASFKVPIFA